MDEELLLREQEYYEINKKLEKRARELLEEVDKIKGHSCDIELNNSFYTSSQRCQRSKSVAALHSQDTKFSKDELKELNLPDDVNNVGAKGFVHFLKTKVKLLQCELDKIKQDHSARGDELRKCQKENAKLQEDKEKFLQQCNLSRSQVCKLETQLSLSQSRLQARDNESVALRKEIDVLKRDAKSSGAQLKSTEAKCQRALDELSKLKVGLHTMKQDEKDVKDAHKKHAASLSDTIRRLEKQKADLLSGFKRQYVLVENLKCQRAHLESLKVTDKIETDLIKMISANDAL